MVRALASHQCVPGSIPGPAVICGLSLLLVLYSSPRGFSPGTPVFLSLQKPVFPNSNSIPEFTGISNEFLRTPGARWENKLQKIATTNLKKNRLDFSRFFDVALHTRSKWLSADKGSHNSFIYFVCRLFLSLCNLSSFYFEYCRGPGQEQSYGG